METCYACKRNATSVEHVPPKCIFPESKDIPGLDLRKNLITVPSCEHHNSAKSNDDEFLMVSLAGIIGNNSIGYVHSVTKVDRALRRRSHKLIERVFISNRKQITLDLGGNKFVNAISGTPDIARLNSCFDHIVKGVYRHHFDKSFDGDIRILLSFLVLEHEGRSNLQRFLLTRARRDVKDLPRFGDNPVAFFYQVVDPDEFGIYLLKLCFYENVEVFCALIPSGVEMPTHLGFELMKQGMPVTFTLDGDEFPVHIE